MRWSMLPVSVAIHFAALIAFLTTSIATDLDLPFPWPLMAANYVAAAATPAPEVERLPAAPKPATTAPREAPDRIEPGIEETASPLFADGGLPGPGAPTAGVPDGLDVVVITAPPPPAAPIVERQQPVRVGGAIREPRKIVHVAVDYPEIARHARIEGLVLIEATIDERGFVTRARILRSQPLLDAAALAALKQWRYTPTLLNGVPVPVLMTITFNFKL